MMYRITSITCNAAIRACMVFSCCSAALLRCWYNAVIYGGLLAAEVTTAEGRAVGAARSGVGSLSRDWIASLTILSSRQIALFVCLWFFSHRVSTFGAFCCMSE